MARLMGRITALATKTLRQADLLRRDPEAFGRNLLQVTNPALFEERLIDIVHPTPMHVLPTGRSSGQPRLNVLDTAWTQSGMTGGPNTAINLALHTAQLGLRLRLVSTVQTDLLNPPWLAGHAAALLGCAAPPVELATAGDQSHPLEINQNDVFLATHWSTALQLKAVLPLLSLQRFFYMLQEFEAGFYAWSSNYARVVETYGMDFWPIVNQSLLADFLFTQPLGRLSDPQMRDRAIVFEPAVDAALFRPPQNPEPARKRRVLFYARPTNSRNMFGLGMLALREAASDPAFAGWDFLSIGGRGSVPALDLGGGHTLRPAPWVAYTGYGDLLRSADILLCPMISPHTSYPVLEMAACGGLSVTNSFATKTPEKLQALSGQIIATEATASGFAEGLLRAARLVNAGHPRSATLNLPRDWSEALAPAARKIFEITQAFSSQP